MTDGEVDIFASEVDVMQGGTDPQIDIRMCFCKAAKPVHEPFGREIW